MDEQSGSELAMEECETAGSYVVNFGNKYLGKQIRQCGKDWLVWCLKQFWIERRPEFKEAAEKYVKYLNSNPGECIIEWHGQYSGLPIKECDLDYVDWFAHGYEVAVQRIFPECCAAGKALLLDIEYENEGDECFYQRYDDEGEGSEEDRQEEGGQDWERAKQQAEKAQQVLLEARHLGANRPEPPVSPPAQPRIIGSGPRRQMVFPTDLQDVRHTMAIRNVGERSNKRWDQYAAEFGDAEDYEYDDFVVEDPSETEDDETDGRSEISAFYEKDDEGDEDQEDEDEDEDEEDEEREEEGEEARSERPVSVIDISLEDSEVEVVETPRKRKRVVALTTDEDTDAALPLVSPVTPSFRRTRRSRETPLRSPPRQTNLPTPLATPDNRLTKCRTLRSPKKTRVIEDSSSSDNNDDEPLSQRLNRRQSGQASSSKGTATTHKASFPSPTSSWFDDQADELSSGMDDFIEDDTPVQTRVARSPDSARGNRFVFR